MPKSPPKKVTVVQVNAPKDINGKYRQEITFAGEYGNVGLLITDNFLPEGFTGETMLEIWDYRNKLYGKGVPQQAQEGSQQATQSQKSPNKGNPPDWDAIAEGKVRTVLVSAGIESGQIKIGENGLQSLLQDLEYWNVYCMTGRAPLPPEKQSEPSDVPY